MFHPLDGARLKIVRAHEHLATFRAEGGVFLDTKPYRFESEVHGQDWWVKPRLATDPPLRLSVIVGDCVTNTRAALDYIVWELAQKHLTGGIDLAKQSDRQILSFPILLPDPKRRKGHIDHLDRLAKRGIPARAIKIIQGVQADASGDASLQWLYELANTDKLSPNVEMRPLRNVSKAATR